MIDLFRSVTLHAYRTELGGTYSFRGGSSINVALLRKMLKYGVENKLNRVYKILYKDVESPPMIICYSKTESGGFWNPVSKHLCLRPHNVFSVLCC